MNENTMLEEKLEEIITQDTLNGEKIVEWGIDHGGSNAIINHLKVKPEKRREGYGSKVLKEIEQSLIKLDIHSIVINMRGGEKTISFLKENDYKIVRTENDGDYITAEKELD